MSAQLSVWSSASPSATLGIEGDVEADITITDAIESGADVLIRGNVDDVAISLPDIATGGAKPSIIQFGANNGVCQFSGDLTMTSGVNTDTTLDILGSLESIGSVDLTGDGVAGTIRITRGGGGAILNGGAVSGTVTLTESGTLPFSGTATFASVSSGGVVRTTGGGDLSGTLRFSGDMSGDISIGGDLAGVIDITGNQLGDIDVGGDITKPARIEVGDLADCMICSSGGRIVVTGATDGAITVDGLTGAISLIHMIGGLSDDGIVTVNANQANGNDADGDIRVGPARALCCPPPNIVYDGCIRVLDGASTGGDLNGDIDVLGCHATSADLAICVDGSINGVITIAQTGCTNQVVSSCTGPCP